MGIEDTARETVIIENQRVMNWPSAACDFCVKSRAISANASDPQPMWRWSSPLSEQDLAIRNRGHSSDCRTYQP